MRQRLGIAQTLVGDPQVLILDEPANGLDPEGIAWMRGLLRDFADRGGTVLLSSHLLHEVQATVDHLVVISQGAVVASGRLTELLASSSLLLRTPDPEDLARALRAARIDYQPGPDQTFTVDVLRWPGHPRDGRARRARAAGAAHRAAPVRLRRARAALLLTHRREDGTAAGGSSMTSTTITHPVLTPAPTSPGPPSPASRSAGWCASSGARRPIPARPAGC